SDLESVLAEAVAEQHFQITSGAEGRRRIAHGCRLAEQKNPIRIWRLGRAHQYGRRTAGQFGRKKAPAELIILDQVILIADLNSLAESGREAITGEAKSPLQQNHQQRNKSQSGKPQPPFA